MRRLLIAAVLSGVSVGAQADQRDLKVLGAPGVEATGETLVERVLEPTVRVGTSTPTADPAGDCTWAMFERIEARPFVAFLLGPAGQALLARHGFAPP